MAELNKIKAEKARDEAEKEAGRREEEEQIRMENILSGKRLFDDVASPVFGALKNGNRMGRQAYTTRLDL